MNKISLLYISNKHSLAKKCIARGIAIYSTGDIWGTQLEKMVL